MYKILKLISQLPEIKKSFRVSGGVGVPKLNVIYNTEDFVSWKESMKYELLKLEQTQFVDEFLKTLDSFNGWRDEKLFKDIESKAETLKSNLSDFFDMKDKNVLVALIMQILLDIENDGYIYLDDDDTRISFVPKYRRFLNILDEQGYFSKFTEDVTGGYEIELSSKAFMESGTSVHEENKINIPTVFVSYNWGCSDFVDKIESALNGKCDIKRDKNNIDDWKSISEFMKTIRNEDFAILVISDAYLKSVACLYEVIELIKDDKWDEKAMYVIMDDAKDIYNGIKRLNYIRYWNDYCNELSDAIKDLPLSATYTQSEELKKAEEIRNNIGEFLSRVADSNNPSVENVISRIIERIEK